jgi:hypothetical protein
MYCQARDRLERRYARAIERFDSARKCLLDRIAFCSQAELQTLSDQVDCACDWLDNSHAMLNEHIRQHCCLAKDVGTSAH